jgi:acyl-CoA thioester hydrolase
MVEDNDALPYWDDNQAFHWPIRVYYEDTDAGGIVFYANYLKFAERGRTEMLRSQGHDHATILRDYGIMFVVKRCEANYLRSAYLDDQLVVVSKTKMIKGARLIAEQLVMRGDELLVRIEVELVCINQNERPQRLPSQVAESFLGPIESLD